MKFNRDCIHFLGSKPCREHKERGTLCETCNKYKQIRSRILVIKLDALGDVLRTTSILPALHEKYAGALVTWITRKKALPLLNNNSWIHRIWAVEENYLEYLSTQRFDAAFGLDAELLSATILSLSKALKKFGFGIDENGSIIPMSEGAETWHHMGLNDMLKKENRDTFFKHLYKICNLPPPIYKPKYFLGAEQIEQVRSFKQEKRLSRYRSLVGINTGGGNRWEMKKWLESSVITLIRTLRSNRPDVGILLYGGPEEANYNAAVIRAVGEKVIDTGCHNSLDTFIALISLCDVFLTPDSLGMHISIALGKTTLVLVGPTSPWELDVFGKGEIMFADLPCIACYENKCNLEENCMVTITPELVLQKILKFI